MTNYLTSYTYFLDIIIGQALGQVNAGHLNTATVEIDIVAS